MTSVQAGERVLTTLLNENRGLCLSPCRPWLIGNMELRATCIRQLPRNETDLLNRYSNAVTDLGSQQGDHGWFPRADVTSYLKPYRRPRALESRTPAYHYVWLEKHVLIPPTTRTRHVRTTAQFSPIPRPLPRFSVQLGHGYHWFSADLIGMVGSQRRIAPCPTSLIRCLRVCGRFPKRPVLLRSWPV